MPETIRLSEKKTQLLEHILARSPEEQKPIAYVMWGVAVLAFVAAQAAIFFWPFWAVPLAVTSFGALIIGMARYGYYRLYRLLHSLAQTGPRARSEGSESAEGA